MLSGTKGGGTEEGVKVTKYKEMRKDEKGDISTFLVRCLKQTYTKKKKKRVEEGREGKRGEEGQTKLKKGLVTEIGYKKGGKRGRRRGLDKNEVGKDGRRSQRREVIEKGEIKWRHARGESDQYCSTHSSQSFPSPTMDSTASRLSQ